MGQDRDKSLALVKPAVKTKAIKAMKLFDYLSNYWLLKIGSAPLS